MILAGALQHLYAQTRTLVLLLLMLLLMLVLPGCDRSTPPERQQADQFEVRIAALSPAIAVILRDLELHEKVVARHGWDIVLDKELPVAGDQAGLDYESLLRARPTHVLMEWGSRPLPARLSQLAQQHNWHLHNYRLLTLADIEETARELHTRFGPDMSWEETPLARRLQESLAPREGLTGAGRILLLYSTQPPGALGPASAHHQVLEAIGGTPALTSGGPYLTLDAEDVGRLAPDGIILIRPRAPNAPHAPASSSPDQAALRQQFGRVGALEIPAVRDGRLALIDHPLGQIPSTSLAEIADEMAAILEAWSR